MIFLSPKYDLLKPEQWALLLQLMKATLVVKESRQMKILWILI
jgi:hypothetical protein